MIPIVFRLGLVCALLCGALPAAAQDRAFSLAAPEALVESGFLQFVLPRFSLKTGVRVTVVPEGAAADAVLGSGGRVAFVGMGESFGLEADAANAHAARFSEWLYSDIGMRAVTGFELEGRPVFAAPKAATSAPVAAIYDGDARRGEDLSFVMCGRCHVVGARNRMSGIGSTPSFAVMKTFADWRDRFSAFYVLKPHPAFTQIEDVTAPFDPERPPVIAPIEMTLDDLENILAFVAGIPAADLGAPIQAQ